MAEYPALPLFTDAIMADCQHLTDEEFGRYVRLLIVMWRTPGCTVPNDLNWICKRLHIDPLYGKQKVQPIIDEFLQIGDDGRYYQKRLSKEYEYVKGLSARGKYAAKCKKEKQKQANQTGHLVTTPTPTPHPYHKELKSPLPPKPDGHIGNLMNGALKNVVNGGVQEPGQGTNAFQKLMGFDIEHLLTEYDREDVIRSAPGWSIQRLCEAYNNGINSGMRAKPRFPVKAFKAWVPKYTKGQRP